MYKILIEVIKIRGNCPIYKVGDKILLNGFYIESKNSSNICMHAFSSMLSLLSAFSHGASAIELGIGKSEDEGYLQCCDPGEPYTKGGTVIFKLKRLEKIDDEPPPG